MLILVWIPVVAFALLAAFLKTPRGKGKAGEFEVRLGLRCLLRRSKYRCLHNVTIPSSYCGTTQVDHIVLSRFGIFVVETKNMKGWIFGSERNDKWTQKIHRNHSQSFRNPLRQNYAHTQALAELLGLPGDAIRGVVVFVGESKFKTPMPDNVTESGGVVRFIWSHKTECLTDEQVTLAEEKILAYRLAPTRETERHHLENIRRRHPAPALASTAAVAPAPNPPPRQSAENRTLPLSPAVAAVASDAPLCPRCGIPMVPRKARRGPDPGAEFWGCSRYPQCRETRQMAEIESIG